MYVYAVRLRGFLWGIVPPLLGCILLGSARAEPPRYAVIDIGLLPAYDTFGLAHGLNNNGDVVGESHYFAIIPTYPLIVINNWHAFLWRDGVLRDLGTLGGTSSSANAINDAGVIVGDSDVVTNGGSRVAFQWMDGQMTALPLLPGGRFSEAYDVNEQGWITGGADTAASIGNNHAVVWKGGIVESLDPLRDATTSFSNGLGINEQGDIAGSSSVLGAFTVWHDDPSGMQPIPGVLGQAEDINSTGLVTGYRCMGGFLDSMGQPFLWKNGTYLELPSPSGPYDYVTTAINDAGDIVGGYNNDMAKMRAILWSRGVAYDLNSLLVPGSAWTLLRAEDINDLGQIVGMGDYAGTQHPFLLTPLVYGDADGNVRVDMADVRTALRAAAGLGRVRVFAAADVVPPATASGSPGDGRIDVGDALRILRHVEGLEPSWP